MSRSGYTDDYEGEGPPPEFWRRAVENASNGKRGQQFFRDLRDALDSMEVKELITGELVAPDGACCTLGRLGQYRKVDMSELLRTPECDPVAFEIDWDCDASENSEVLAKWFNIAPVLAREAMYMNDEGNYETETDAQRWVRIRKWVARELGEVWMPPALSQPQPGDVP